MSIHFALELKKTFFKFRVDEEETLKNFEIQNYIMRKCSYEEAHNWIYGAVAFALEAGIEPNKNFLITQYILEDDTEDIPLIDMAFGLDGMHYLFCESQQEADHYIPTLKKHLGDNFKISINLPDAVDI